MKNHSGRSGRTPGEDFSPDQNANIGRNGRNGRNASESRQVLISPVLCVTPGEAGEHNGRTSPDGTNTHRESGTHTYRVWPRVPAVCVVRMTRTELHRPTLQP